MLRILLGLIFLASCSTGTVSTGGDQNFVYDAKKNYSKDELMEMSPKLVTTLKRDPRFGKLDDLFGKNQKALLKIGILIFESSVQPTLGGLAQSNKIYLSEQGKQLLTENLLSVWDESFPVLSPELNYVKIASVKNATSLQQYGFEVFDYVKSDRDKLAPDDIFYLDSGKKTTTTTVLNPRGMRDLSFMLVPAYELMGGPKWSEHNKHFLNDLVKELELDAAIIVMSELSWTSHHKDKYTNEFIPEELTLKISASTLLPLHLYNDRLEKTGNKTKADVTLCYRSYETKVKMPVEISVPPMDQKFETIEKNLLNPMLKTYKDLSQMTMLRIVEDLKKTW